MRHLPIFVCALIASSLHPVKVYADKIDLGSGYSCDDKLIKKGSKTLKLSVANTQVAASIQKANNSIAPIKNSKKPKDKIKVAKLKLQIKDLKVLKTLFKDCTTGKLQPTDLVGTIVSSVPINGVEPLLTTRVGRYVGTLTADEGSAGAAAFVGPIQLDITLTGTVLKGVYTFPSGGLKTLTNGRLLAFQVDVKDKGFRLSINQPGTSLGTVETFISPTADLYVQVESVPANAAGVTEVKIYGQFQNVNTSSDGIILSDTQGQEFARLSYTMTRQ